MEQIYKAAVGAYKNLVEKLVEENIATVDSIKRKKKAPVAFKCLRDKVVIPYLGASPKSNFLCIAPINIFTKDDPILRYVPSVRSNQPSSIIWFEGTVFGTKALDSSNMVDAMFLRYCTDKHREKEAVDYLKAALGRDSSEIVGTPNAQAIGKTPLSMEDLFCPMCRVFGCGLHRCASTKALSFREPKHCICENPLPHAAAGKKSHNHDYINPENDFDVGEYNLSPCIASLIVGIKLNKSISCDTFPKCTLGRKKVTLSRRLLDPKQFFEPCEHAGRCLKSSCGCIKSNVYCESFCSCTDCSNVFFCSCTECDDQCPCLSHGRECSDLCRCDLKYERSCGNRPVQQRTAKKVSICKSPKHGLGLFCEEPIRAHEFVIQYTGELISDKEAERRGNFYEMNKLSYLFNCAFTDQSCLYSVDAFFLGNKSRFINHSASKANLKSEILVSEGNAKIVFYSLRDIYKGEEFFFDYQFTEEHKLKHGIID